jgi:hypothetical protein
MFKPESLPVLAVRTLTSEGVSNSDFEFLRVPEVRCIYFRGVGAQKNEAPATASDGRLFDLGGLTADENSMGRFALRGIGEGREQYPWRLDLAQLEAEPIF